MTPIKYHEHKEHTFDAFCKKVLTNEARDYFAHKKIRLANEVSMSDLAPHSEKQVAVEDSYPFLCSNYLVFDFNIVVKSDYWAELIDRLPEKKRQIILLYYFQGLNDKEIGKLLNTGRSTIQYQRIIALQQLKTIMEK